MPPQVVPVPPPQSVHPNHNTTPTAPQRRVSRDGYVNWTSEAPISKAPKNYVGKKRQTRRERMGRKYDHLRTAEPVIIPSYLMRDEASPWSTFVQASSYGRAPGERSEKVDSEKFDELMPGFNDTSSLRVTDTAPKRRSRRAALHEHIWRLLLNHPLVPALLRFSVLVLSIASLALSANLWKQDAGSVSDIAGDVGATLRSQWLVAIIVDCVITPYIVYMTWDEYSGPQLGLRSPMHKVFLTNLDLFFIIFKSASATLAFSSLYATGTPRGEMARMKALAAFLLLGLLGWVLNFTVNVFRLVQRLGPRAGDDEPKLLSYV